MKNKIYIIMVMKKIDIDVSTGHSDFGCTDIVGFYTNFKQADSRVKENACDINETCYDYAIIEEVKEGLYQYPRKRWLYKYNKDNNEYEKIEEPDYLKRKAGLTI